MLERKQVVSKRTDWVESKKSEQSKVIVQNRVRKVERLGLIAATGEMVSIGGVFEKSDK